jgi:TPR repeat protein
LRPIAAIFIGLAVAGSIARASTTYDEAQAALAKGDTASAIRLFQAAAERGDAAAAFNLGRIFSLGQGVRADPKTAAIWFRRAADEGNPGGQYRLGFAYEAGLGVPRNPTEAARWYLKAASQNYADAEAKLAALYAKGQGVPQDDVAAARWYRAAAGHGDASAALDLALLEARGIRPPATIGGTTSQTEFKQSMNQVFGAGHWRETGGYRSQARENELRREGALTVRPGTVSRHSVGTPDSPGAYDIVVAGMSPGQAAAKIKKSGVAYKRLFPEGAHGTQGAHLHVEPFLAQLRDAIWRHSAPDGAKPPEAVAASGGSSSPARDKAEAISLLKSAAARGDSCAQKALGQNAFDGEASARAYLTLQRSGSCG